MWRQFKKVLLVLVLVGCGGVTSAYAVDTVQVEYLIPQPSQLYFGHALIGGGVCQSGGSLGWALLYTKQPYGGNASYMASYPVAGSDRCNSPLVWYIVPSGSCMFVSDPTQASYTVSASGPGQMQINYSVLAGSGSYSVVTSQAVQSQLGSCVSGYQFVGCGQARDDSGAIRCCWADGAATHSECGWN